MRTKRRMQRLTGIMVFAQMAAGMTLSANAAQIMGQISAQFERQFTEDAKEYAVIQGVDADGSIAWTYRTDEYMVAQLDRVAEIGAHDGKYYFCEGETIKALDLVTGVVLWENEEFGGSVMDWLFDRQGILYVCGYLGPDLFVVTPDGSTAKYIGTANEELYWPSELEWYDESTIEITYEGGGLDPEQEESLLIDVSDVQNAVENGTDGGETAEADAAVSDAAVQESSAGEDIYYVVNCKESITLRTYASVYADEICQIPLGAAVEFLGLAENGFYSIRYNGQTGYSLASYLSSELNTGYSTY